MLYLRNLASSEVFQGDPCDIQVFIPPEVREDKVARHKWQTDPTLEHCMYNLWEGVDPKLRVSNDNEPRVCHGLALDFDAPATEAQQAVILEKIGWPVYAVEQTLTPGHWRPIFLFEAPFKPSTKEEAEYFLKAIYKKLKIGSGFEKKAFINPSRYYTSSGTIEKRGEIIPKADCLRLFLSAMQDYSYREHAEKINLKIDEIEAALKAKYPEFETRWNGPFVYGAMGETFWISESASPRSATVHEHGMHTFSGHAPKSFYSWSELLGKEFVEGKLEDAYLQITQRVYRSQREYYFKYGDVWVNYDKNEAPNILKSWGISSKAGPDGMSEIDRATEYIRRERRVEGSAPFLFNQDEIVEIDGRKILNEMAGIPCAYPPAAGPVKWGPDGEFPWLSHFFDTFFEDAKNALPAFIAWLSRFYKSAYHNSPCSGQAVIIAGGVGVGKTFLTTYLIPALFLCKAGDPNAFLTGQDAFGGQLFRKAVWTIDDGSVGSDPISRRKYSENLKRVIANQGHHYHLKYHTPVDGVTWQGRFVGTCNLDPHSIRAIIPDLDLSNLDKIMLFRATDTVKAKFELQDAHLPIIEKELAAFCRYLLDYEPPEHLLTPGSAGNRFGVKSYHDESLLEKSKLSSPSSALYGTVQDLKKAGGIFQDGKKTLSYIDMGSTALFETLCQMFPNTMRSWTMRSFVATMETLAAQHEDIVYMPDGQEIVWRLKRDD